MFDEIIVRGARLHNLKNVDVRIPRNQLVVFTGVSGSGKSSLAFDILYREGARQYMESLGLVTDGMSKPPVDEIRGLSPSISVDQSITNRSPRSTVGTSTEVFTYLRVLFARLGHRPCPACGADVPPSVIEGGADDDDEVPFGEGEGCTCPACGARLEELGMASFSFNKPAGACPTCTGLGVAADLAPERVFDETKSVAEGGVLIWDAFNADRFLINLERAGSHYGFRFDVNCPLGELDERSRDLLFYGVNSPVFIRHYPEVKPPATVLKGHFEGVVTNLHRRYTGGLSESGLSMQLESLYVRRTCPDCGGARLRAEARAVRVDGRSIIEVGRMPLRDLAAWLGALKAGLNPAEVQVAAPILADLEERTARLIAVGVGYLTLERSTPNLSTGEAQRLRLAALLGSGLTGMLYVLDEPTIGLHQSDTQRLIHTLRALRDLGNTVLVIEHDLEMIRAADHVIEFGPGAGVHGGRVVSCGSPQQIAADSESLTGAFLCGREALPRGGKARPDGRCLTVHGAREHNLKDLNVRFPLGALVAVTGVSGSGKSSLVFDILDRAARRRFYGAQEEPGAYAGIEGWEHVERVVTVDQAPIGRVPRSNAATYTDTFSALRTAYAATREAARRGFKAGHFSFNVPGGRCDRCEGAGTLSVNMHFLPDVQVRCPVCRGRRFKKEILEVRYHGVNISEALEMTIGEAAEVFRDVPAAAARLKLLQEVGLGYLMLGQPATTLSGGEAQRVKLAKELARGGNGRTLYLLDEPTTGLHPADTRRLVSLLRRLVDAGSSVIVVEHNLELVWAADWVIDLGPEGGEAGGYLLAEGTPSSLAQAQGSQTGDCLRALLK